MNATLEHTAEAATKHAAEELPNFITLLEHIFPKSDFVHFLVQRENVFFSFLVLGLIAITALIAANKKSFLPKGIQNLWEIIVEGIENFVTSILGHKGLEHVPFLGTIFLYILFQNWLGIIPLFKSPTSAWSTTIALSLVTMVYIQLTGIKEHGLGGYLKHLSGNPAGLLGLLLVPLMLVINLSIEFLAVPLSLSLRLFANVSSEDKLLFKFAELNVMYKFLPFFFQLFANVLVVIFSFVQAFVFLLLSTVYISLILPHDHEEISEAATENNLGSTH